MSKISDHIAVTFTPKELKALNVSSARFFAGQQDRPALPVFLRHLIVDSTQLCPTRDHETASVTNIVEFPFRTLRVEFTAAEMGAFAAWARGECVAPELRAHELAMAFVEVQKKWPRSKLEVVARAMSARALRRDGSP